MLSSQDLETLIASKKRGIEKEKALLGLSSPVSEPIREENKLNVTEYPLKKEDSFNEGRVLEESNANTREGDGNTVCEREEPIPPGLERYIRRYIGLPGMLKAGEFSPNNPLIRGERVCGDALLGLGEYERRRHTLRKIRQQQYREYLDRQAKKKQEAKEEAEKERRDQEQKEIEREERERLLLLERDSYSPERRRASVSCVPVHTSANTKVDSAVQVNGISKPSSVAVQTDDAELYRLSPSSSKLTQAERELSPRTVAESKEASWNKWEACERRRSYGDFDERTCTIKKSNRDKLHSDLRHSYMPSIFDADAIELRNMQAEKDAAEKRQFYQQELRNQIMEQQRIRDERKTREKLLEQAEMRRLEEQLRMLRVAQEREIDKQQHINTAMNENAKEYESKRTGLQQEIDIEQKKLRAVSHPTHFSQRRAANTAYSEPKPPHFYPKAFQPIEKKPYSMNIPDNSVFSKNYDVDSYLRKNLNFNKNGVQFFDKNDKESETSVKITNTVKELRNIDDNIDAKEKTQGTDNNKINSRRFVIEKALVHAPKDQISKDQDSLSVPVLRHSPKIQTEPNDKSCPLSEAMKKVEDKWKVPAVQKNILKSMNEEGKNISILTQLGSIRRQLQLEQLKLDKMLSKNDS